jgi:protein KRI1
MRVAKHETQNETMAPVALLFDDDDNDDDDDDAREEKRENDNEKVVKAAVDGGKLKINKRFAREYESRKLRQELHEKRNDGDDGDDDDTGSGSNSDSDEEDEAGILLTTQLDTSILKTIHALRTKDQRIYDPTVTFFAREHDDDDDAIEDEDDGSKRRKTATMTKEKPKYITDVVREQVLQDMEQEGEDEDDDDAEIDDDDDDNRAEARASSSRLAYDATQQEARRAFLDAIQEDEDGEEEPIVKLKTKRKQPADDQDNNPTTAVVDPKGEVKDGEAFLLDFFKHRPWRQEENDDDDSSNDDEDDEDEPAEQVVPMKTGAVKNNDDDDDDSLDQLENAETFEAQYNFRFEQAAEHVSASGADRSLQSYARRYHIASTGRTAETRPSRTSRTQKD